MKENVFLIFAINEKRKEKQQLLMNIEICKQGVPLGSGADNLTNEQQKEIEQPKAYLFRTAKNVALTRLTKKSHQITDYIEECSASVVIDNVERPDKELEAEQKFGLYCEALASLSDKCREVFLLRKVHGLPHKEIAERMGLTVSSVEKYLRTGILECQDLVRLNEEQRSGSAQKLRKSSVEIEKQR